MLPEDQTMSFLDNKPKGFEGWDAEKDSRAVIACKDGEGVLLWWVGYDFAIEHDAGLRQLGDLGLDDAPDGISIWEGQYQWSPGGFEHPEDGDRWPSGTFRAPTDDEWIAIRKDECPWEEADWRVEGWVDPEPDL